MFMRKFDKKERWFKSMQSQFILALFIPMQLCAYNIV